MPDEEPIRLMRCTCCGAQWTELESSLPNAGCAGCGSSVVALERNLTGEAARIIKLHGTQEAERTNND